MRLLIVGQSQPEVVRAAEMAAARGASVRRSSDLSQAFEELRAGHGADVLLVDVASDIAALRQQLAAERFFLPVVAYGIHTTPRAAAEAIRAGAREFLPLPPDPDLIAAILEQSADDQTDFVAEDPRMLAVLDLARKFAPTDASVLITGESGTGKEVMARFIHRNSRRAGGPFISVNCAAIPENLLESELFGHEKGAFTGAAARRIGKFEEAHGGTLLLDEISEMDPRLQAKLLRAIQEREIDRVGGSRPIKVDIRLIGTSNRDMEESIRAGHFREDLYFRLNVLRVQLPALRERPGDIVPLARWLLRKHARANQVPDRPLTPAAMDELRRSHWQGNVREPDNCMHRAVLLASGSAIGPDAILFQGRQARMEAAGPAGMAERAGQPTALVGRTVAEVERGLIIDTLQQAGGNRTHAAAVLGISIRTLRNKLKQYATEGAAIPSFDGAAS
ncbi:MAG TPA: sigma-54 dependent transcriptional regulator [Geminicoccus sp.]|jgi:DNA-binding NtrC family response regulator|uniref:sigma-54 interaction domain-containing protein n=1 Tax=Geminicoccus sp. TaxID=2024832 RepID=UPI002E32C42A|nr:sigma-54 dependent transcriptional regulator [Geminicoccus sp.]HEX2525623.1 sigma-54 dependent transcriptional regulator [Geminicoccus sp.]